MGALKPGYEVTPELTLGRRLGAGGMGTVWIAKHAKLGADVVVKFLSEALTTDPDACARFSREVVATVQVRSPHIVQTLDHGITESGVPYIVMELLEGDDLSKLLRQRKCLRPDEVVHIVDGVAAALMRVHELGIVHRDIKPANIFMCAGGPKPFVKLVDFGIAKRLEDETMTATHAMVGTPTYMSPEQMDGSPLIDHRSDLWALGVLTFHMLAGTPPFRGAHVANIVQAVFQAAAPKLTPLRPELPDAIDVWMAQALARSPSDRFSSAQEMADALATAFGDLAFATTRRSKPVAIVSGLEATVVEPALHRAMVVRAAASGPTLETIETTLGASSITQAPSAQATRRRWAWALGGLAALLLVIGAAVRVGYGLRQDAPALAVPAVSAPLAAADVADAAKPTSTATSAATETPPAASSVPRPHGPARPPTTNKKSQGRPAGEDDIGF